MSLPGGCSRARLFGNQSLLVSNGQASNRSIFNGISIKLCNQVALASQITCSTKHTTRTSHVITYRPSYHEQHSQFRQKASATNRAKEAQEAIQHANAKFRCQ